MLVGWWGDVDASAGGKRERDRDGAGEAIVVKVTKKAAGMRTKSDSCTARKRSECEWKSVGGAK